MAEQKVEAETEGWQEMVVAATVREVQGMVTWEELMAAAKVLVGWAKVGAGAVAPDLATSVAVATGAEKMAVALADRRSPVRSSMTRHSHQRRLQPPRH